MQVTLCRKLCRSRLLFSRSCIGNLARRMHSITSKLGRLHLVDDLQSRQSQRTRFRDLKRLEVEDIHGLTAAYSARDVKAIVQGDGSAKQLNDVEETWSAIPWKYPSLARVRKLDEIMSTVLIRHMPPHSFIWEGGAGNLQTSLQLYDRCLEQDIPPYAILGLNINRDGLAKGLAVAHELGIGHRVFAMEANVVKTFPFEGLDCPTMQLYKDVVNVLTLERMRPWCLNMAGSLKKDDLVFLNYQTTEGDFFKLFDDSAIQGWDGGITHLPYSDVAAHCYTNGGSEPNITLSRLFFEEREMARLLHQCNLEIIDTIPARENTALGWASSHCIAVRRQLV